MSLRDRVESRLPKSTLERVVWTTYAIAVLVVLIAAFAWRLGLFGETSRGRLFERAALLAIAIAVWWYRKRRNNP